jgi:hypothetical protein
VNFSHASFSGFTTFEEATFDGDPLANRAGFESAWVEINRTTRDSQWPHGWEISSIPAKHPWHSGEWARLTQDV